MALNDHKNIFFFIEANAELRRKRMIERGDNEECIKQRLLRDESWFNEKAKEGVNYIVENENKTLEEIAKEIYDMYIERIR